MRSPWSLLFSRQNKPSSLSLFFQRSGASALRCSSWPFSGPTSAAPHVSCSGGLPGLDTVLQMDPHKGRVDGDNPLPLPAATPLLMQPRILLAFWAVRAHCVMDFIYQKANFTSNSNKTKTKYFEHMYTCTKNGWDGKYVQHLTFQKFCRTKESRKTLGLCCS